LSSFHAAREPRPVSRRRLALALLLDPATTVAIDDLRRSLGTDDLDRIPPHITLVPPIDLIPEQVDQLWPRVIDISRRYKPFALVIGPAATFAPRTMTIHLAVGGDLEPLGQLADELRVDPVPQRRRWPFVPHVTLRDEAPTDLIEHSLASLADVRFETRVDALHLLEHLPRPGGGRNWWQSMAICPFAVR
jgi:2'-5' RNA ligase